MKKSNTSHSPLTSEKLLEAQQYRIKNEQEKFFPEKPKCLRESNKIEKESPIYNYKSYLVENKTLRLDRRLHFSDFIMEEKHSVILPKHSWLTQLIIRQEHEKLMHGGVVCTYFKLDHDFGLPKVVS